MFMSPCILCIFLFLGVAFVFWILSLVFVSCFDCSVLSYSIISISLYCTGFPNFTNIHTKKDMLLDHPHVLPSLFPNNLQQYCWRTSNILWNNLFTQWYQSNVDIDSKELWTTSNLNHWIISLLSRLSISLHYTQLFRTPNSRNTSVKLFLNVRFFLNQANVDKHI